MKILLHNYFGFMFDRFRWYRRLVGGDWSLINVKPVDVSIWVLNYKGESQDFEIIKKESWS